MFVCLNRGTTGGDLPLEEFASLASAAGFQGADVDLAWGANRGPAALADLYASHNLRFGGWGLPVDHRTEPALREQGLQKLRAQAAVAAQLKIDSCATWIMPSSPQPFMETWKIHVEGLRPVAAVLAQQGLRLGLECVAPFHLRRQFPHEFVYTPGLMLELAAAIGPNVGLLLDCFHLYCGAVPWAQVAQLPSEKIVLAHLNDVEAGPLERIEDGRRRLPGEGVINLPAFLKALQTAGYRGPVSLEAFGAVKDLPAPEAARRAWTACRRLLDAAGFTPGSA